MLRIRMLDRVPRRDRDREVGGRIMEVVLAVAVAECKVEVKRKVVVTMQKSKVVPRSGTVITILMLVKIGAHRITTRTSIDTIGKLFQASREQ